MAWRWRRGCGGDEVMKAAVVSAVVSAVVAAVMTMLAAREDGGGDEVIEDEVVSVMVAVVVRMVAASGTDDRNLARKLARGGRRPKKERRVWGKGFATALAVLKPERLKVDKARKESHKPPTKSLLDVGSRRIFIFTVNTYVSLRCSGNTTRIMRKTLAIGLAFHSA
uniref:Uncharacterized protein n=1 Tax=Tanacetum cinerariifolium TaxID=118510 RepID=A0A6L2MJB8_TANCI|nr:hypothetical protein [Tanacetum cinerariifolium]